MTETARDIALAILALEEVVTTLRALFDDLNEPDPEPAAPVWPTAPYVWHGGEVWKRRAGDLYESPNNYWEEAHMTNSPSSEIRDDASRFAREAVPVTLVPTVAWEKWKSWVPGEAGGTFVHDRALIEAVDSLAQEVAR